MTLKLVKIAMIATFALAPVATFAQSAGSPNKGSVVTDKDKDSPSMQTPGKIQKETNPRKNGVSQSESTTGMNKNGQPQQ